uniref:Biotin carboxyl carrier protein of acetyl-CoA carboxylase n=1 Tax=Gelidium gabrielsonii TaxID=2483892 RepID=A0A3G2QX40_9FLOR|nr:acetyl-CoA carboxylase biotin carboxyl carrier protein [Gelidium gabrielsonii]AYO27618.1 acetyl-CoA carboxylase biotin carboxyl carrier protein [Gelidium gabrielsonii]
MKFQIGELKKMLTSIEKNHIQELQIKSKDTCILINKNNVNSKIHNYTVNEDISLKTIEDNTPTHQINESKIYSTIISPMVGTFYRSPAPNEAAFVEKYDIVEKKQIVCIIEAMKLMNEIEAEVKGEVVEILVKDGDIVDCGQALMKVKTLY